MSPSMNTAAAADALFAADDGRDRPFFAALAAHTFDRRAFLSTQLQFRHAVAFFARPMAILAARVPTPAGRLPLVHNVWEEHGEGTLSEGHDATFRALLARFGVPDDEVAAHRAGPGVRIFNAALLGAAAWEDPRFGLAVMGMIERMFVDISARIGRGIVEGGLLPAEQLTHYRLHTTLDVRHAADFFSVIDSLPGPDAPVEDGLRVGHALFLQLFDSLYHEAHRALPPAPPL